MESKAKEIYELTKKNLLEPVTKEITGEIYNIVVNEAKQGSFEALIDWDRLASYQKYNERVEGNEALLVALKVQVLTILVNEMFSVNDCNINEKHTFFAIRGIAKEEPDFKLSWNLGE